MRQEGRKTKQQEKRPLRSTVSHSTHNSSTKAMEAYLTVACVFATGVGASNWPGVSRLPLWALCDFTSHLSGTDTRFSASEYSHACPAS